MAAINTVQSGVVTIAAGSASQTVAITSVDMTKSFLIFNVRIDSNEPQFVLVSGELTNATTLTFERVTAASSPAANISWYVAEFTSGVTVERGSINYTTLTSSDTTITAIDAAKAFPIISWRASGTAIDGNDFLRADLTTTTNLQITSEVAGAATHVVKWQVVQFDSGASVQAGSAVIDTGDTTKTAAISSIDTTKSMLVFSYKATTGTTANIGQKTISGTITNSTTLTFDRYNSGSTANVKWYVISFTDGTSVQRGSTAITATNVLGNATVSQVGLTKTVAMITGRTRYDLDDNPGYALATGHFTTDTNLRLTRAVS